MKRDPQSREWLDAAERGDEAAVLGFLDRGMDVIAGYTPSRTTALMRAARGGQTAMVRLLLDRGADHNPENSLGYTALTYALIRSRSWEPYWHNPRVEVGPLEVLLAAGAGYRLREAVLLNDLDLARTRLDEGADVNEGFYYYNGPMIKLAAERGYLEMVDMLLDRGADIDSIDDCHQTALVTAARSGCLDVVRRLLDRGANIDAGGTQSSLANAAARGHRDVVDLLLSRGARRGVVDALARSEMDLFKALVEEELRTVRDVDRLSGEFVRLATYAVRLGNIKAVRFLLNHGAAHRGRRYEGHTLLAEAARCGHADVARLLLERGADLHDIGDDGLTPLGWALHEGRSDMAEVLRSAGAER